MAFASSCIVAWSSRVPRLLPIAGRAAADASLCSSVDATAATRSGAQAGHAVEGAIRARGEYRLTDNASYAAAEMLAPSSACNATAESPNRALIALVTVLWCRLSRLLGRLRQHSLHRGLISGESWLAPRSTR
jgi:hypothetical protein